MQSADLKIDKPNGNIAKEYLRSSEETLSVLQNIKNKVNSITLDEINKVRDEIKKIIKQSILS